MALVKNTNSYVTREEANTYFADRIDVAAWTSASDAQKDQALVTATSLLENLKWTGIAISESQSLSFPRSGSYFDPKLGYTTTLPATVPDRVIKATFELAYHLLNNDGLLDDTGTVTNLSVGQISLNIRTEASTIPSSVKRLINVLLQQGGSSSWWRAN